MKKITKKIAKKLFVLKKVVSLHRLYGRDILILSVAFFIATSSNNNLHSTENTGYLSGGCCTSKSVIVSSKDVKGSLSLFEIFSNNYNFLFKMEETTKNATDTNRVVSLHEQSSDNAHSLKVGTPADNKAVPFGNMLTEKQSKLLKSVKRQCLRSDAFYEALLRLLNLKIS